ncbi:hypothetical protein IQ260_05315 [Leptolyngbya cf. ectocarpi LEGE 11479]|uniref:DUF4332 domain-containing protein n=1 Tax=Leptolyngbya cf. ectocarpi LEGE 11479 TaxID=1828722 RepID=A0A928WZA3_LEPEC|nr:hypothetical protein [Leptolyngbya ectocarpi]MBE9066067.1 hypothetical protein [Leptolyngbya cf. ectocarpi LEGE 11479]
MADSATHKSNGSDHRSGQESLTQIEGIGKVKKQWLESIGITTLKELARAVAVEIEEQLSMAGHTVHLSEIEKWMTQAQLLVAETAPPATHDLAAAAEDTTAISADTSMAEPTAQIIENWQTFAAFTVEFQANQDTDPVHYRTLVRHLATDQEETWSGIEEEHLQSWLRSQVAEVLPSEPAALSEPPINISTRLTAHIENLFILQPPSTATAMGLYKPNMMFPSPIKANFPFSLVVQFSILEQEILAKMQQAPSCRLESYVRNLKQGESLSLGKLKSINLPPQQNSHTAYLPTTSLQKGIYRLQVLLILDSAQALPTLIEVPVLQVT